MPNDVSRRELLSALGIGALAAQALLGIHQLTREPINCIFELVSAGLARPHVSNAVIGKMLSPLGCDQSCTTLRAPIS